MKKAVTYISGVLFGIIALVIFPIGAWQLHKKAGHDYDESLKHCEGVYFEGEVFSAQTKRGVGVLCVKIDSANVDSFYFYNRQAALIIKSGVATFPLGLIDKNDSNDLFRYNSQYVIVNKDKSGQMLFLKECDTLSVPLSFFPSKIGMDMPICANL